jgi:hypothetical protein
VIASYGTIYRRQAFMYPPKPFDQLFGFGGADICERVIASLIGDPVTLRRAMCLFLAVILNMSLGRVIGMLIGSYGMRS